MKMPNLQQDIVPLSRFRAELADTILRVRESKRPVVVTQHGETSVVVVDVEEYQKMVEELETIRDIAAARSDFAAGRFVGADVARQRLLDSLPA